MTPPGFMEEAARPLCGVGPLGRRRQARLTHSASLHHRCPALNSVFEFSKRAVTAAYDLLDVLSCASGPGRAE